MEKVKIEMTAKALDALSIKGYKFYLSRASIRTLCDLFDILHVKYGKGDVDEQKTDNNCGSIQLDSDMADCADDNS